MVFSSFGKAAEAATLTDVRSSAAIAVKLISRRVAFLVTYKGPLNVLPLTFVVAFSETNSNFSGRAPTDAFQGNPCAALAVTCWAS